MSLTSTGALLLVGVPGGAAPAGATATPLPPPGPGRALALAEQLDAAAATAGGPPALVLVHEDRPLGAEPTGPLRHDLALARAAVRGEDVVVRVLGGPLTRSLLLARLVAGLPPAVATSLVAALAPGLRTYALLGAVGRLERPAPTLAQHARGLAPGGCFLVDEQGVSAVKGRLPRGLGRGAEAVLARGPGLSSSSDWPERLWSAVGPTGEAPEPVPSTGRDTWGTGRCAEVTVSDLTAADVADRVARSARRACTWCSREVLADLPCPHCGAAADAATPPTTEAAR